MFDRNRTDGVSLARIESLDVTGGGITSMRRRALAVLFAWLVVLGGAGSALASQPPGLLGYEGQPGNQGGHGGNPPGCHGYEGQPGNQGC
jgi:hypothetical protein